MQTRAIRESLTEDKNHFLKGLAMLCTDSEFMSESQEFESIRARHFYQILR
jgi:hypothetical protein